MIHEIGSLHSRFFNHLQISLVDIVQLRNITLQKVRSIKYTIVRMEQKTRYFTQITLCDTMSLREYYHRYVPSNNEQRNTFISVNVANSAVIGAVVTVTQGDQYSGCNSSTGTLGGEGGGKFHLSDKLEIWIYCCLIVLSVSIYSTFRPCNRYSNV